MPIRKMFQMSSYILQSVDDHLWDHQQRASSSKCNDGFCSAAVLYTYPCHWQVTCWFRAIEIDASHHYSFIRIVMQNLFVSGGSCAIQGKSLHICTNSIFQQIFFFYKFTELSSSCLVCCFFSPIDLTFREFRISIHLSIYWPQIKKDDKTVASFSPGVMRKRKTAIDSIYSYKYAFSDSGLKKELHIILTLNTKLPGHRKNATIEHVYCIIE